MLVERIALKAGIFLAGQHYYTSSGPQTKLPRVAEEISTCDDGCTAKDFEQHGALQWIKKNSCLRFKVSTTRMLVWANRTDR